MSNSMIEPGMFAIKYTNQQVAGPCAVCGGVTEPSANIAIFLANSFDPVCDQCGITHAPTLAALVTMYHTIGGLYVRDAGAS